MGETEEGQYHPVIWGEWKIRLSKMSKIRLLTPKKSEKAGSST